jgi:hypothetical protein
MYRHIYEGKAMARTKRAQVLMEPDEYDRLEEIAADRGVPVAELFRTAVRERYLLDSSERRRRIDEILALDLPVIEWDEVEEEAARAHGDGLP